MAKNADNAKNKTSNVNRTMNADNDFENADKHLKKIRKSKKITEYEDAVEKLFSDCEFRI